jgi:tetratricopeptide (TPR) repeat protein
LVSPAFRVAVYSEQHLEVAMGFKHLGGAHYYMGNFPQSEQHARKAADLYTSLYEEAHVQTANAYNNLSMAVLAYADKVSALVEMYALKALAICEKNLLKLVGMVPLARINLGNSYVLLEQYDEALTQFDQVAGIAALSGNAGIPMLTKVYNNKATVFERRKRYVEQKEQLLMAAKLLENRSEYNIERGMTLVNLGLAYLNNQ